MPATYGPPRLAQTQISVPESKFCQVIREAVVNKGVTDCSIPPLGPGDTPLTPGNTPIEMLVSHSPEKSSLCATQSSLIILLRAWLL